MAIYFKVDLTWQKNNLDGVTVKNWGSHLLKSQPEWQASQYEIYLNKKILRRNSPTTVGRGGILHQNKDTGVLTSVAQLIGASAHAPKGHRFDSLSKHIPRLRV